MVDVRLTDAAPETGRLSFSDLPGWASDDHGAALAAFRLNPGAEALHGDPRAWFERVFRPGPAITGHFTGYYEPEIDAALSRNDAFPVPLHALPAGGFIGPRAVADTALAGHELAWVADEVARFFLQVQGSGRLRLIGGGTLRVGFAGKNGHPYRSIGKILVERGALPADLTADDLKAWLRADHVRGHAAMAENPSYVMFRPLDLDPDLGPMGTHCPVTPLRSIAVDPDMTPLGTPVWIETAGRAHLVIAQDTGSAITGAGRADLFFGTGAAAGSAAGALNHPGRFVPLVRR